MTTLPLPLLLGALALGILACLCCWHYRHQRLLKVRAHLMREAIRCKDYSFRLPVKGLFFGERALQAALNDFTRDISTLMAQQEVEAWQRLTRVLTHEIMNAASPICSITQTYLADPKIQGSPYEEGIEAIHKTSMGMMGFVQNFRKITCIQEPQFTEVDLSKLLHSLKQFYPDMKWCVTLPENFLLRADEGMLQQVFANLVKNAAEAGAKNLDFRTLNPSESIKNRSEKRFTLWVSNDGSPIPADVKEEIFVPFFTTKKGGTGIGLTLSRQMMIKQKMDLQLAERSMPGYHTTFVLSGERNM